MRGKMPSPDDMGWDRLLKLAKKLFLRKSLSINLNLRSKLYGRRAK